MPSIFNIFTRSAKQYGFVTTLIVLPLVWWIAFPNSAKVLLGFPVSNGNIDMTRHTSHASFFNALILFPVLEEFVFRSFLMSCFQKWIEQLASFHKFLFAYLAGKALLLSNGVTSILFALLHWRLNDSVLALLVFVPSFLLGVLYQRHRLLLLNVAVHGYWNFLYLGL
jgi:membrane protease YdiL (CAAX protease family)